MKNETLARELDYKGLKIEIHYDNDPLNPRTECDNLGTMVCWHRRYSLGDKHDFKTPEHFQEWLKENEEEVAVILPLHLYDHGGITISTGKFSCPWDSGQVGYIYMTKARALEQFGVKTWSNELESRVEECLENEVKAYDDYITGNCYGYKIIDPTNDRELDSCWGYLGETSMAEDEAKSNANWYVKEIAKNERILASHWAD